jgi:hypothetical protein
VYLKGGLGDSLDKEALRLQLQPLTEAQAKGFLASLLAPQRRKALKKLAVRTQEVLSASMVLSLILQYLLQ